MKQEKNIERMFRQHYEKMYNLARSILSDDDESNDVVSEVFTTILADDVVLMPESEEGFLMRSVRNRCFNLIAYKSVKERVAKLLLDDADVILSEETDETARPADASHRRPGTAYPTTHFPSALSSGEILSGGG